jgi:hypothetical protein
MRGISMRENREIPCPSADDESGGRVGKAAGRTPMMYRQGKSDSSVVPTKAPNNAAATAAEGPEGRELAKRNTGQSTAFRTQSRGDAPSALDRVREVARRDRQVRFTALLHHVTIDRLRQTFLHLHRHAAAGIDGVTWEQYATDLEQHLRDLHTRLYQGAYRAKASRRVNIPKADGRLRPAHLPAADAGQTGTGQVRAPAAPTSAHPVQGRWLDSVVRGHNTHYPVPTNHHALQAFRTQVERHWRWALMRRSQRGRISWARLRRLSQRWLPTPRILHPWPAERFHARTQGRSPVR